MTAAVVTPRPFFGRHRGGLGTTEGGMARSSNRTGIVFLMAASLIGVPPLHGAVIEVDGVCTLVDAITAAQTDTATGSCPAGSHEDEIHLLVDVTVSSVDNTLLGDNGLPLITTEITILGNGHTISRSPGSTDFRLFFVHYGGKLILVDTTISGGFLPSFDGGAIYSQSYLSLLRTTVSGNTGQMGGAILAHHSLLSLIDSTVSQNSALAGGGVKTGASTTVLIMNSVITGNEAKNGDGGGINTLRSDVRIVESTISDNTALFSGGGIAVFGGTLELVQSTVSGNSGWACDGGGGVAVIGTYDSSAAVVTDSTLSGNTGMRGGGIVALDDATATVANTTISSNMATVEGGGIAVGGVGSVTLVNSLVAHSTSGGNCAGVIDGGNNLADDTTCGTIPGSLVGLDPILADHGGSTMTHSLDAGSNAVNLAGDCGLDSDQRGFMRHDGSCDSGSFEVAAVDPLEVFDDGFDHGHTCTWSSTIP
jgi:hypothetical protein